MTGVGRRIGRATALCLAAEGAQVVANDRGESLSAEGTADDPAELVCGEIVASMTTTPTGAPVARSTAAAEENR